MTFWKSYFDKLKNLTRNWGAWLLILMVLIGGHSPTGKVIAVLFLIVFMPIFQMMFRFEPRMFEYRLVSYPNLKNEERVLNDPRIGSISETFSANNNERARQIVREKYGLSQDVELYDQDGHKLEL